MNAADKLKWNIWVSGYGGFDFEGTEEEAEEMRSHKARWEGGRGLKWRADPDLQMESDRLTQKIAEKWEFGEGVPQSWLTKLREAKLAEQSE